MPKIQKMKKVFLLLVVVISFNAIAQITIRDSDMPQNGDSLRYSVAFLDTAVLLNYQTPGANQIWRFDSLQSIRQEVRRFVNSNQTPYNAVQNRISEKLLDTLAIGPINFYDVYDFYQNNPSDFSNTHRGLSVPTGLSWPLPTSLKLSPTFSDKDEIYQFPLNYLDRDSSTFAFTFGNTALGVYYASNGYRINEVDAWGSLITPYDTFNCIRVVTDLVRFDSVSVAGTAFGISTHTRQYKWLTPQLGIPAMEVDGIVLGNLFIPTNVIYRDSARGNPTLLAPVPLFIANNFFPAVGDTVSFTNLSVGLFNTTYNWKVTPNNFNYSNGTSSFTDSLTLIFTDTGFYNVGLAASNNFGTDSLIIANYIYVNQPISTSIESLQKIPNELISLYPNPINSKRVLNIKSDDKFPIDEVIIYNLSGQRIKFSMREKSLENLKLTINQISGIYFVVVRSGSKLFTHKLLIKE